MAVILNYENNMGTFPEAYAMIDKISIIKFPKEVLKEVEGTNERIMTFETEVILEASLKIYPDKTGRERMILPLEVDSFEMKGEIDYTGDLFGVAYEFFKKLPKYKDIIVQDE